MEKKFIMEINDTKRAAIDVLLHNSNGPYGGLPRTAGWGYPEPYTRDLMISTLGVLLTGNEKLIKSLQNVLKTLAKNQTRLGHIPSLVHNSKERGASDTTPLFLLAVAIYRNHIGDRDFLKESVNKALVWMEYQSPSDRVLVSQLPTSDWRDEQWVLGYGLYVNTIVYAYLQLLGLSEKANRIKEQMERFLIREEGKKHYIDEGLLIKRKPYYALWSYKIYNSERFDLLGNSFAIIMGIASPSRAARIITWVEKECHELQQRNELALDLPPNFFPYIIPGDTDWHPRYAKMNAPGEYHNGGIWPFVCGFYVAALIAAGKHKLAEKKFYFLTKCIQQSRTPELAYGFNEWYKAQDGSPQGNDWQSWSASMYLYAAACIEEKKTPFFEKLRKIQ
ncbi:MAG: glycoside hydrolase 100 family protein [Thermodesulfobacteriota bacterium]|nr:glycoside hydrolase 100 family protein [Thermodesulfobacteriota bacterium]